ncbi:unnamed protein product, partial [Nesidiocoris tenuis]
MCAEDADNDRTDESDDHSGVFETVRYRKDAGAQAALHHVKQGVQISEMKIGIFYLKKE